MRITAGAYYNAAWKYAVTGSAISKYEQTSGVHTWWNAASGTAGNNATFSQYMTLTNGGDLGIGETSPASGSKLALTASNPFMSITGSSAGEFGVRFKSGASDSAGVVVGGLTYNNTTGENRLLGPQTYNYLTIYTSNSERARIDAAGNFGLAVVPSAWSSSFKALQVNSASLWSTGSDASLTANAYYDGSNYRYITSNGATRQYHNTNGSIAWSTAPSGSAGGVVSFTGVMTLQENGGLQTLNTIAVGNATPSTSGAGITFPATQSASSNANTLDDYEEGTWTPTLGGETTNPTSSYNQQDGTYTKIGNIVTINFNLYTNSISGGSGNILVEGLPFTCSSNGTDVGTAWTYNLTLSTGFPMAFRFTTSSSSRLYIDVMRSNNLPSTLLISDWPTASIALVRGNLTYRVA
jgi:hypothetical protein